MEYRITETIDLDPVYERIAFYLKCSIEKKLKLPVEILSETFDPRNSNTQVAFKIKDEIFEFTLLNYPLCDPFDLDKAIIEIKNKLAEK